MQQTIGKNFENALSQITSSDPNSEYYIPLATTQMTCEQLQTNYTALEDQIKLWTDRLNSLTYKLFSGDKEAARNMGKIITIQSERMVKYSEILSSQCGVEIMSSLTEQLTGGSTTQPAPTAATTKGINPLLLIAAVGTVTYFVTRKKRR